MQGWDLLLSAWVLFLVFFFSGFNKNNASTFQGGALLPTSSAEHLASSTDFHG
jgi:hypothetical protein